MLRAVFLFFLGCTVASRGGYQMARGRHYAKLSLSNAARLSFSDLCILLFMFLSLCRLCVCVFLCSHWSLVDVPLIFFCPADHVPDWQPRVLLGMVEARSVNVKKTTTTTTTCPLHTNRECGKREAHITWSMVKPEKTAPVTGTTLRTTGPVPADSLRSERTRYDKLGTVCMYGHHI